ncbi:hypothetical protein EGN72_07455 [Pseudorhodobacter sp. E13]|uniref:peptidoglycan-binding protein n=1 Tax=Pseudorhodobacter sp. E13 TaxID=2487931 RepID=UPI000F8F0ED7|nr:peptidoglycan-binding protein [Pseudorhodobacter sp. E13]RUS60732.1 hypothetical protein EGN72_07455 [Pseudorhodobacter sp. E13]
MLLKTKAIAAVTALSLSLTAAAPAHALGKNERNFLKGIAAALIVGAIVNEGRKAHPAPAPAPQPVYRQPAYEAPRHRQTEPVYQEPRRQAPKATQPTGRIIGKSTTYGSGVQDTTAAQVFNSYSRAERLRIQAQLARFGYYTGAIDGAFGPRTHQAVYEFARSAGKPEALNSTAGTYRVYNALLG